MNSKIKIDQIAGGEGSTEKIKIMGAKSPEEALEVAEGWCEEYNSLFEKRAEEEKGGGDPANLLCFM